MLGAILELGEWIIYGVLGWRYIFSKSFRKRTHQRWKLEAELTVFMEVVLGLSGVVLTLLPLWFVARALLKSLQN